MVLQAGAELWIRTGYDARSAWAVKGTVYGLAAAVDALHGVSMLALATVSGPGTRRRAALSAALAALFIAGDLLVVRAAEPPPRLHPSVLMEV